MVSPHLKFSVIDCIMSVLDEGLLAMPKDCLGTPLPKEYQDREVIEVNHKDVMNGACNNVPLGNKKLVMTQGTQLAVTLKRGDGPALRYLTLNVTQLSAAASIAPQHRSGGSLINLESKLF